MSSSLAKTGRHIAEIAGDLSIETLKGKMTPRSSSLAKRISRGTDTKDMKDRLATIGLSSDNVALIADQHAVDSMETYARNIENYIGCIRVPVGIAGPLRVNGIFAHGDFYLPLATTEAALVASYNRGARAISMSGGCSTLILSESMGRAPGFAFDTLRDAAQFVTWAMEHFPIFQALAAETTTHGELINMEPTVEGNHVYLLFEFLTGDASGQNMVTIATQHICNFIVENSPLPPVQMYVEANFSGDKKSSYLTFTRVRGKKVSAEAVLGADIVRQVLRTTPEKIVDYYRLSSVGGVLSGAIGIQGHYSNGLAALFLACGQDVACVAEGAVGLTRLDLRPNGDLYAAVTLPGLIVGTVGGGTGLPTAQACLSILGLNGKDNARAFAEVAASMCLAGELSIMAALTAGDFSKSHQVLARGHQKEETR